MKLVFGLDADGRAWPETVIVSGDLDDGLVGPQGLVGLIETQLGLAGPSFSRAVRVAAWLTKLRNAGSGRFWEASFEKDAWSTAHTLLDWRDNLIANGWDSKPVGAPRIDDLSAAELAGAPLPLGLADRIALVCTAIATRPGLRISSITLIEPRPLLPAAIARLIDALEKTGITVSTQLATPAATASSDLRKIQEALLGNTIEPLSGDGSIVFLDANTELMAAEVVADWLATGPSDAVILAPDSDTSLLDQVLKTRGLPALGLSAPSRWRGTLQMLPLAFATAWKPFNARALLDLMTLPTPPIPRRAARRIAQTLAQQPGIGSEAWIETWSSLEEDLLERNAAETNPQLKTARTIANWRAWTDVALYDRTKGMPVAAVREIAGRVETWAMQANANGHNPLLLGLASTAATLSDAVSRLGLADIPAHLLERMIGQVMSDGVANPEHIAEAGQLRAISKPGALWRPAQRVIWWGFTGPGERVSLVCWDQKERNALSAAGVLLDSPTQAAERISNGYLQAMTNLSEQILLVRPALSGGEPTIAHPLAHQLRPILKNAPDGLFFKAEQVLTEPQIHLAKRSFTRMPSDVLLPPRASHQWTLKHDFSETLSQRVESATSLDTLFNCQMGWFTQYVLKLRKGRHAELPDANQLFGTLAHEIACRLLQPGTPPLLATVRASAQSLFDELVPQIAAPLAQPEHAKELVAAREQVPAAIEALVGLLHESGLEIVGAELARETSYDDLHLTGRIDLLVRRDFEVAVLDLKWTRSERRYVDMVASGTAVQLAVYHALARNDGSVGTGGYFLLRQRRAISGTGSFLTGEPVNTLRPDDGTLRAVAGDWKIWSQLTRVGTLVAAGIPEASASRPDGLEFEPADDPCRYCDLTGLCRVNVETL